MTAIWKFQLQLAPTQWPNIPFDPKLLTVQIQDGHPMLWALVDPERRAVARAIHTVGTEQPFELTSSMKYIGTYQQNGFVWHVFDGGPA